MHTASHAEPRHTSRRRPPERVMQKNAALAMALKQWNLVAWKYDLPRTQRKGLVRKLAVERLVDAMQAHGIDWRDKLVWRELFKRLGRAREAIETAHGSPDFRVTFDWAIALKNTAEVFGLDESF